MTTFTTRRAYDFTTKGVLYAIDYEYQDGVQVSRRVVTDLDPDDVAWDRDQIERARISWEMDQEDQ